MSNGFSVTAQTTGTIGKNHVLYKSVLRNLVDILYAYVELSFEKWKCHWITRWDWTDQRRDLVLVRTYGRRRRRVKNYIKSSERSNLTRIFLRMPSRLMMYERAERARAKLRIKYIIFGWLFQNIFGNNNAWCTKTPKRKVFFHQWQSYSSLTVLKYFEIHGSKWSPNLKKWPLFFYFRSALHFHFGHLLSFSSSRISYI